MTEDTTVADFRMDVCGKFVVWEWRGEDDGDKRLLLLVPSLLLLLLVVAWTVEDRKSGTDFVGTEDDPLKEDFLDKEDDPSCDSAMVTVRVGGFDFC